MRSGFCWILAVLVAAALFVAQPVLAQETGRGWTLASAVARSQLIFAGEVIDIAYRESEAGEGLLRAPHTFVTYRLEEVLRGSYAGDSLTLRLTGGYEGSTGRIMLSGNAPMFRLGDKDILLVTGNGSSFCPLAGCGLGRFRLVEGAVFSNLGLALRLDPEGRLTYGPDSLPDSAVSMVVPPAPPARLEALRAELETAEDLDAREAERLKIMLQVLSREQKIGIVRVGPEVTPAAPPIDRAAFAALIKELSGRYPLPDGEVVSVSAEEPFTVPAPVPAPVRLIRRPSSERQPTREEMLLRRNDGNPVLGSAK